MKVAILKIGIVSVGVAILALAVFAEFKWPKPNGPMDLYGYEALHRYCYPDMTKSELAQLYRESFVGYRYRPYTYVGEAARTGRFCNVSEVGYRQSADETWPMKTNECNVWFFGGSTMFGYGVTDTQTIPARFKYHYERKYPGRKINVYNFGAGCYQSSQEHIWFERLLMRVPVYPVMVVFMDGLNDAMSQNRIMYEERFELAVSNKTLNSEARLGENLAIVRKWKQLRETYGPRDHTMTLETNLIGEVFTTYVSNVILSQAVGDRYGIVPLFIWQPVPMYKYDLSYHPFAWQLKSGQYLFVPDIYERMAIMDLRKFKVRHFLNLSNIQSNMNCVLYVDACHYNPGMCDYIAAQIAQRINCKEDSHAE